jgi:hypothetical protein
VFSTFQTHEFKNGEKENLWQREKEREGDERIRRKERGSALEGEIVVSSLERVGVASQGCVCVARASEIEYDRSGFLFKREFRELECACVREGRRIGITLGCSRMFIHFDVGMDVESHVLER